LGEMARLRSTEDLDALMEESKNEPVLLFKHSSTCGVSFAAMRELERFATLALGARTKIAILEVQTSKPLSNEVAERMGIRHESPQAMVLCKGEPVWNASHWKITANRLEAAVAEAASPRVGEA
jgi:bacillithiol system protein YtxJ